MTIPRGRVDMSTNDLVFQAGSSLVDVAFIPNVGGRAELSTHEAARAAEFFQHLRRRLCDEVPDAMKASLPSDLRQKLLHALDGE